METSNATDWNSERIQLALRFSKGDITSAKRKELERYMVVLANTPQFPGAFGPNDINQTRHERDTEAYATIIRHLLAICLGEELHHKSHTISVWALGFAILSFFVSVWAVLH